MFSSVALNVVIGLIFIFLLYSLLGTILLEVFANSLNLRAIHLEGILERMLTDDDGMVNWSWWRKRVRELVFRLTFGRVDIDKNRPDEKKSLVELLFEHASVKAISRKNVYGKATWIPAPVFADVLLDVLCQKCKVESIDGLLEGIRQTQLLGKETKTRLIARLNGAAPTVAAYKAELAKWFEEMMDLAGGWYKGITQKMLLALGFLLAMGFNVNTIDIAKTLAKDPQAAEQIMSLAQTSAQIQGEFVSSIAQDSSGKSAFSEKDINDKLQPIFVASLLAQNDAAQARNILGFGWEKEIEAAGNPETTWGQILVVLKETFTKFRNLISFFITALAISLGAPFWFDLLKKIVNVSGGNISAGSPSVVIAPAGPTGPPVVPDDSFDPPFNSPPVDDEEVLSGDITAEEIPERDGM